MAQLKEVYTINSVKKIDETLDIDTAQRLINTLQPLLELGDTQAEEASSALYQLGKNTAYCQQIKVIHQHINNFDFEEALSDLVRLDNAIKNNDNSI